MLPETLCTSPTSAHLCIHQEHDDSQRDLENFARLANFRGPSQKGDSVCVLTLLMTDDPLSSSEADISACTINAMVIRVIRNYCTYITKYIT